MSTSWRGLRWRTKLLVLLVAFACLPVLGMAFWVLRDFEQTQRENMLASLEGLANAKSAALEQLTVERKSDVERIATLISPNLEALLAARQAVPAPPPAMDSLPAIEDEQLEEQDGTPEAPPAAPTPEPPGGESTAVRDAAAALRHSLTLILWDQTKFEELMVIDAEGRIVTSTFAEHEGRSAADRAYFRNGRGATSIEGVFLSPVTERLTMVIATPIRNADSEEIGVLAARMNLTRLFALIGDTAGLGETGETVVSRADGDVVEFMAPTRHDPDAVTDRRLSLRRHGNVASAEATAGQAGAGARIDYRGKAVLAAWRSVPSLGWGVTVKLDEEEAMRTTAAVRLRTLEFGLILIVFAVLASLFVSRELVRPLRQLKDATDRISRGDFGVQLTIRSADEIGELADSFERMLAAIKFFREHARTAEEDAMEDEPEERASREERT